MVVSCCCNGFRSLGLHCFEVKRYADVLIFICSGKHDSGLVLGKGNQDKLKQNHNFDIHKKDLRAEYTVVQSTD